MYDAVRTIADPKAADGNNVRLLYDGTGRLSLVTDTLDHEIRFVYYADNLTRGQPAPDGPNDPCQSPMGGYPGLLKTVTDHMGREVRYCYDDKARLRGVALPEVRNLGVGADYAGASRRILKYTYDDAAPTARRGPQGEPAAGQEPPDHEKRARRPSSSTSRTAINSRSAPTTR